MIAEGLAGPQVSSRVSRVLAIPTGDRAPQFVKALALGPRSVLTWRRIGNDTYRTSCDDSFSAF